MSLHGVRRFLEGGELFMVSYMGYPEPWTYDLYEWDLDDDEDDDDYFAYFDEDDDFEEEGEQDEDVEPTDVELPEELKALRELEKSLRNVRGLYVARDKSFYKEAKSVEDFECFYEGTGATMRFGYGSPSYATMTDYQLLMYFDFRTRFRHHESPDGPNQFITVLAYELIDGIGAKDAMDGYEQLCRLRDLAAPRRMMFDVDFTTWIHDYALFWDLDKSLIDERLATGSATDIITLMDAENALIKLPVCAWPSLGDPLPEGLPEAEDLFDALSACSRYHAEKSRMVTDRREDVAQVACRVFARMVDHCHKRRKVDYVEGLANATYHSYSLFRLTPFYAPEPHPDVTVRLRLTNYRCEKGQWYRLRVAQVKYFSKDLGDLLHTIDCALREAVDYPQRLRAREIPKYQQRIVDQEVAYYLAERKRYEATRIRIDKASLTGIRSSSIRTREALLTDEERAEEPTTYVAPASPTVDKDDTVKSESVPQTLVATQDTVAGLVTAAQADILNRLLAGQTVSENAGAFLSLEIDAINEAFLDIVGDTVIEFAGEGYVLVEDYIQEVREALAE